MRGHGQMHVACIHCTRPCWALGRPSWCLAGPRRRGTATAHAGPAGRAAICICVGLRPAGSTSLVSYQDSQTSRRALGRPGRAAVIEIARVALHGRRPTERTGAASDGRTAAARPGVRQQPAREPVRSARLGPGPRNRRGSAARTTRRGNHDETRPPAAHLARRDWARPPALPRIGDAAVGHVGVAN